MRYKNLKRFRVVISVVFLVLLGIFFLDFAEFFPPKFITGVLFLQFVPSLLKFFNVFSLVAAGFIVIFILTLLFGRVYCSTICPLGILQDVISYLKRKFKKKKRYNYKYIKSIPWLRYSLLGVTAIFLMFGNILLLGFLDPYSIFGRITSDLFRPVLSGLTNIVADVLNNFDIYGLNIVNIQTIHFEAIIIPAFFLVLVVWMSLSKGRFYCNTICPVGTFLGLLSKISIFQIKLDENTCTKCGLCENACKGECINYNSLHVDFSRCVGCFNCLAICPESSTNFELNDLYKTKKTVAQSNTKNSQPEKNHSTDRRKFMGGFLLALLGASKLAKAQNVIYSNAKTPIERKNPVSPPGAQTTERFNNACTACHLCVNVCPSDVLQPAVLEYGYRGLMQPRLDNHAGFCNYECTLCGEVCPTGAILPISTEDKRLTQIGKAQFVIDNCIVETEGTDCGSCAEHCPTKAVRMVDYKNNLRIPEVTEDICIGCGACEYACPTIPFKAIFVEGNPVHERAKEPQQEQVEEVEHEDEFPF
ncbi:MAG: 4Fe-4S dicluster domain-containing protein [Bacteroidales bacterium]